MNRPIKFRAQKSTGGHRGEWVYGYFHQTSERPGRTESWITDAEGNGILVYADSVGQFTGLTDKNGKEIYEGDVVRYSSALYEGEVRYDTDAAAFVLWGARANRPIEDKEWLVIGNVWENPELLKV